MGSTFPEISVKEVVFWDQWGDGDHNWDKQKTWKKKKKGGGEVMGCKQRTIAL